MRFVSLLCKLNLHFDFAARRTANPPAQTVTIIAKKVDDRQPVNDLRFTSTHRTAVRRAGHLGRRMCRDFPRQPRQPT